MRVLLGHDGRAVGWPTAAKNLGDTKTFDNYLGGQVKILRARPGFGGLAFGFVCVCVCVAWGCVCVFWGVVMVFGINFKQFSLLFHLGF